MDSIENKPVAVNEGKNIAIISYFTIIGLIIAFVMNNEKKNTFANYHIRQSLGLALTGFALGMIVSFFGIFVIMFMWIMGLINAINGIEKPVPLLGEKYLEWLKNL